MRILKKEIGKKKEEKKRKGNNHRHNLKSRDEKDDLIQRLKRCHDNDNIFNYIDKKYKKYIIKKNKNDSSQNNSINKEKNETYIHNEKKGSKHLGSSSFIFFESINSYELKKYKSAFSIYNILLNITKINMQKLYDENNFLNKGWSDQEKLKELKSDRSKLILGFLKKKKEQNGYNYEQNEYNHEQNEYNHEQNEYIHEQNEYIHEQNEYTHEQNEYIHEQNKYNHVQHPSEHETYDSKFSIKKNTNNHFIDIIKTNDKNQIDDFLKTNPIVCFVHFRFTPDYYPYQKNIICYLYEIQIIKEYIKIGIGTHLINILEQLCKNIHIHKILCTVLKSNYKAVMFYKNKCSFQMDESSPDNFYSDSHQSKTCEYEILKKDIIS
ncbi:acetyltransferase, GNAT family, putative [Plasmodium reichenowi]|uniref:N-alpha-acetyltransferase 40 n=1 Tax=Plasmodium reichenowi TaxID=5854 RepID=A0A2P9DLI5_PLARE|nr:acetyltransferase, GNAT family, putative [Plasmodium reichenowi]